MPHKPKYSTSTWRSENRRPNSKPWSMTSQSTSSRSTCSNYKSRNNKKTTSHKQMRSKFSTSHRSSPSSSSSISWKKTLQHWPIITTSPHRSTLTSLNWFKIPTEIWEGSQIKSKKEWSWSKTNSTPMRSNSRPRRFKTCCRRTKSSRMRQGTSEISLNSTGRFKMTW